MPIQLSTRAAIPRRPRLVLRALSLALAELAGAALLLGAVEVALLYSGEPNPPWVVLLFPIVGWIYVGAGVVAWWRRSSNRMGPLMIAGGFAWHLAGLANTPVPALIAFGLIVATVPLAIVVHLLHAFPSGRLRGRLSRATVVTGYVTCTVLQAPVYLVGQDSGPAAVLQVADRPDLARGSFWVQTAVGAAVMVITALVLAARLRRTARPERCVVGPLFAYGIFAVVFVTVAGSVKELFPWGAIPLAVVQLTLLALVPVAFAFAMLRGGFAHAGEIEELGAWLGAESDGRTGLRDALADALGDPSVELLFWASGSGGYVNAAGRLLELPIAGSDRAAVEVETAGRRVGAIVYDARLIADTGSVRAAGRVTALALDHERLTAELRASREGLRQSRARVVEAAEHERRRIARDLHDGLQTRLILLAIAAERVRADANGSGAAAAELQAGLNTAISELRELVRGVFPAALMQGGLYAAAEDLADRAPIPIELQLEPAPDRLPAPIESTGYFVLSEALANAIKHARARELHVYLGQTDGLLRIEVADDGVGGARHGDGTGLRGMADRVEAHDGHLVVESPAGGGTRVIAEVPCGS